MVVRLSPVQAVGHYLVLAGVALYLLGWLASRNAA